MFTVCRRGALQHGGPQTQGPQGACRVRRSRMLASLACWHTASGIRPLDAHREGVREVSWKPACDCMARKRGSRLEARRWPGRSGSFPLPDCPLVTTSPASKAGRQARPLAGAGTASGQRVSLRARNLSLSLDRGGPGGAARQHGSTAAARRPGSPGSPGRGAEARRPEAGRGPVTVFVSPPVHPPTPVHAVQRMQRCRTVQIRRCALAPIRYACRGKAERGQREGRLRYRCLGP